MWCKEASAGLPLTVTPVQQMHSEWNTKWKQWLWLYHTGHKANKTDNRINVSQEITTKQKIIPTLISSTIPSFPLRPCLCHSFLTSQHCISIHAHCTCMHHMYVHTHTHTHTPLKTEEPNVIQTMDPWIHRQKS